MSFMRHCDASFERMREVMPMRRYLPRREEAGQRAVAYYLSLRLL